MIKSLLPAFFKHRKCDGLVRIGGVNDGGYVLVESDIKNASALLSFGLNIDWNFEQHFSSVNKAPIWVFDASTTGMLFVKRAAGQMLRIESPVKATKTLLKYFSYKNFFQGNRVHSKKFVGSGSGPFITMKKALSVTSSNSIFVKMDIEGSEYRCFDALLEEQDRITGLVIELHDVDLHLDRISHFIKNFKLNLVHIHANNYASVSENLVPLALELTFSRSAIMKDEECTYPSELDQPCGPELEEILIEFAKN